MGGGGMLMLQAWQRETMVKRHNRRMVGYLHEFASDTKLHW